MQYIVEAENLFKTFGDFVAVNRISFRIREGECFGILGPNGAGKTTTVRMVYGFSPLTGGTLRVFGLDISSDWRQIKRRIGVCQQENSLDPDLTVQQNLEVFGRYFDIPIEKTKEKTGELLAFVALDHRRGAQVAELSGGMVRRLVIARSLINDPDLLILDEPTSGLDPQSRHQIWDRLEALRKKGITILLTTHYMEEASRLCDRLMIVDHGLILVEGKPGDLIEEHVGRNITEVYEPSPELRSSIRSGTFEFEDLGHRMIVYSDDEGALYRKLTKDFSGDSCMMRKATLEDVFLKLTGRDLRE